MRKRVFIEMSSEKKFSYIHYELFKTILTGKLVFLGTTIALVFVFK